MSIVFVVTTVIVSLLAFSALAQDPTAEPTVDPALTPVATDMATLDPTLAVTADVTVDATVDVTIEPTIEPTIEGTLEPTLEATVDTAVTATTDPAAAGPTATVEGTQMVAFGSVSVQDLAGNGVGSVVFTTMEDNKVLVTANFINLAPGIHGMHIHSVGDCQVHSDHYNPAGTTHPNHAGDLPALFVNSDGTAAMTAVTDRFTVAELFDADGSTLNIHALPDNYAHIPPRYGPGMAMATPDPAATPDPMTAMMSVADEETLQAGDSGDPIACGVIEEGFMAIVPTVDETATPVDGSVQPPPDMTATTDPNMQPTTDVTADVTADATSDVPTVDPALTATVDPALTSTVDPALTPVDVTVDPNLTLEPTLDATAIPIEPTPSAVEQ
jgi:Cu-Zn family superoxide dismutase